MLDFYLIEDTQDPPAYPEALDLQYVGTIDFKMADRLWRKNVLESISQLSNDFRWTLEYVAYLYELCTGVVDTDICSLQQILKVAVSEKKGLMVYAD